MIEQELPHGNIEIPKYWNFPEKNNPGLKIEQLDIENNFVAVSWPTILDKDEEGNPIFYSRNDNLLFPDPSEYADYILRPDGTPLSFRHHSFNDTTVVLSGGDISAYYSIKDFSTNSPLRRKRFNLLGSFIENTRDTGSLHLAGFIYEYGTLRAVGLGTTFRRVSDTEDGIVKAPAIILSLDYPYNPFDEYDISNWKLVKRDDYFREFLYKEGESPNKISFTDGDGEDVYWVEWRIEQTRSPLNNNVVAIEGNLVVDRTHIPTKTTQTFRGSLETWVADRDDRIREILLAKPPYKKDENGSLVVTWRNIDRIVGASLSYSYPPPKQS